MDEDEYEPAWHDDATQTVTFFDAPLASVLRAAVRWLDEHPGANVWNVDVTNASEDGDDERWQVGITRQAKTTGDDRSDKPTNMRSKP